MTKTTNEPEFMKWFIENESKILSSKLHAASDGWTAGYKACEASRLSTLEAAVEERDETIIKIREGYQEMLDWFDNAPFDYRNGVEAQGTDEGEYYGHRTHKMLSDKARALLAETAPKVQSEEANNGNAK